MKRLMRVSFVVVLLFVLAFGLLQLATGAAALSFSPVQPNVGWHSGVIQEANPLQLAATTDVKLPCVGWHS